MRVSVKRCHTACIYYRNPYSSQKTWKSVQKSRFSRECHLRRHRRHFQWPRNVVWDISHEKYFHQFSNSYFESCFCSISLKSSCFFKANLMVMWQYSMVVQTKPYENQWHFDEIRQKLLFKIGVGNLIKIFSIRNAPNNIPWSLKVSLLMPDAIFPPKTMIFSWFLCFLTTVGIPIVNARTVASLYINAHFYWGWRARSKLL